jgi:hypothetical protein
MDVAVAVATAVAVGAGVAVGTALAVGLGCVVAVGGVVGTAVGAATVDVAAATEVDVDMEFSEGASESPPPQATAKSATAKISGSARLRVLTSIIYGSQFLRPAQRIHYNHRSYLQVR